MTGEQADMLDNERARELLQGIYDQKGELTPELVVAEAADPNSPLHDRFEWDDAKAAAAHRIEQARALIRSVRVTYAPSPEGEERTVRAFVSVRSPENGKPRAYLPTETALADDAVRKLLLSELKRELKALERKYGHLEDYAEVLRLASESVAAAQLATSSS